jgi:hypothetical protein
MCPGAHQGHIAKHHEHEHYDEDGGGGHTRIVSPSVVAPLALRRDCADAETEDARAAHRAHPYDAPTRHEQHPEGAL